YRYYEDGDGVLHPEHDQNAWHVAPDWVVPRFTYPPNVFNFSLSDVCKLLRLAKQNGVRVDGTTVEAVEVMDDYCEEITECEVAYAFDTGDFTKLRESWGDEAVDDLLRERMGSVISEDEYPSDCDECWSELG
ncbi:hypothetical protein JCM5296_000618, partial [Sporobolomyces johnsonii]